LWTFFYVIIAVASPWFVRASWVYVLLVLPFAFKVLQEFWRYFKSDGKERWLAYFMWVNLSMLIFIFVPVVDKWSFLFFEKV
jgi:protoheme IX farnesyltransferase